MAEAVRFGDVEAFVITNLTTPETSTEIPNPRPDAFTRVLVTGGAGRANPVTETATVVVESWALDETTAQDNAQDARHQVNSWSRSTVAGVHVINVVEVSRPANLPHPDIPQARYTQTFDITFRGVIPSAPQDED